MTRIESPAPGTASNVDPPRHRIERATTPDAPFIPNPHGNGDGNAQAADNGPANGNGQTSGAIGQVFALRTTLREAAVQTTELVRLLKAEKRQTRQLRSALSLLRELQPLEI